MFVVFLFLFSYGVFCFFDLIIFIELKELQKNSKLTLYQLKSIHFISLQINLTSNQIKSTDPRIYFKSISNLI